MVLNITGSERSTFHSTDVEPLERGSKQLSARLDARRPPEILIPSENAIAKFTPPPAPLPLEYIKV